MRISGKKREKISEQVLAFLYSTNPRPSFTSRIAEEVARDEEFTKKLLLELKKKKLVVEIKKNSEGIPYIRRSRWKLSEKAYKIYSRLQ